LGKVLIIGGYNGSSFIKTKVDLVDLNTGELCPFYPLPSGSDVNAGEGIFANGKTFACHNKNKCVSWNGTTWLENDPPNFPIQVSRQAATILESGQWITIDTYTSDPPATAIYDPDTNSFLEGPTIDVQKYYYGFCMVEIEPNKLGFLMLNGHIYHYQLPNGPLEIISNTGIDFPHWGSCNVVFHEGIKTGYLLSLYHSYLGPFYEGHYYLGMPWEHLGNALGMPWECLENVMGMPWECLVK
jgi:hypothetical protein